MKKELIDGAEAIFERKGAARKQDHIEREDLERKIGQMIVEPARGITPSKNCISRFRKVGY